MKFWTGWKLWQKILAIALLANSLYWANHRYQNLRRQAAIRQRLARRQAALANAAKPAPVSKDPDDNVVLKAEHPATVQDEKNLKGRTLWVSAGGQMNYYPFNGHSVDFSHQSGVLLGAEKILVKDAVEQAAPKAQETRFPDADAEVLLVFTRPDDPRNPGKEYAVAVGDREGREYNVLTDQLFFYDDPHQLYAYWGPKVWQSIDAHEAALGMTERQLQMALGQVMTPRADIMGDVKIEFDNQGKPKLVTFANGKAVAIRDESQ
jgi:hypothetical protein